MHIRSQSQLYSFNSTSVGRGRAPLPSISIFLQPFDYTMQNAAKLPTRVARAPFHKYAVNKCALWSRSQTIIPNSGEHRQSTHTHSVDNKFYEVIKQLKWEFKLKLKLDELGRPLRCDVRLAPYLVGTAWSGVVMETHL